MLSRIAYLDLVGYTVGEVHKMLAPYPGDPCLTCDGTGFTTGPYLGMGGGPETDQTCFDCGGSGTVEEKEVTTPDQEDGDYDTRYLTR